MYIISRSNLFTGHFVKSACQINLEVFFQSCVLFCLVFIVCSSQLSLHSFICKEYKVQILVLKFREGGEKLLKYR